MPIYELLRKGVFSPEEITTISAVYEKALLDFQLLDRTDLAKATAEDHGSADSAIGARGHCGRAAFGRKTDDR